MGRRIAGFDRAVAGQGLAGPGFGASVIFQSGQFGLRQREFRDGHPPLRPFAFTAKRVVRGRAHQVRPRRNSDHLRAVLALLEAGEIRRAAGIGRRGGDLPSEITGDAQQRSRGKARRDSPVEGFLRFGRLFRRGGAELRPDRLDQGLHFTAKPLMRQSQELPAGEGGEVGRQRILSRRAGAIQQDRDRRRFRPAQGRGDLNPHEIVRVVEPPDPCGVGHGQPVRPD